MKILIDNALSPVVARSMRDAGYDSVHVRDLHMEAASDQEILGLAEAENRLIVSADSDFGALLALRQGAQPSFILFRKTTGVRPAVIGDQLRRIVSQYAAELEIGCIITVGDDRIRIRRLPIA